MTPPTLLQNLRLPIIGAPMFTIASPMLVIAQCKSGIVGSFPSLSARTPEQLDSWLSEIRSALDAHDRSNPDKPAAPFAVNLIVHATNARLEGDLALCAKHKVPIVITSLGAREDVYDRLHEFGAIVFHDVTSNRFGHKAISKGADALVAVANGAGGHAGALSPFALISELRRWFDGPIALAGAIASGDAILAAEAIGADFSYIGSAFIATEESAATPDYKLMITQSAAEDIIYTDRFSGIPANYLRPSIIGAGLDPEALPNGNSPATNFATGGAKAWRDIWGSGQGIGVVDAVVPCAKLVDRLEREYRAARSRLMPLDQAAPQDGQSRNQKQSSFGTSANPPSAERIPVIRMLHTIHAVRDIHATRKLYQDCFGAIAFAERFHPQEDRDMALLYAADHMIEPMAPRRPEAADTTFARYLAKYGEGFHSFELRIDDAKHAAELCRARGMKLATVYPTFFFVHPADTGGVVVELCGKPLANDLKDNRGWRDDWIAGHPSGLIRLDHICCVVRDIDRAQTFFLDTLDGKLLSDDVTSIPQPCRKIMVRLGDTNVALLAPMDPEIGPLSDYIAKPSSGVFALVWQVEGLEAAKRHFTSQGLPLISPYLSENGLAIDPAAMAGARHEFICC